jgi:hypothetical protein
MADEYDYGKETKTIVFEDNDHRHAKFFIKLRYDGFRQSEFFRQIISSYIDGDELFMEYVDSIKPQAKAKIKKSKKLRDKGNELKVNLGLTEEEVEDIFDLIEQEHPDL